MAQSRRPIFFNNKTGPVQVDSDLSVVHQFHQQLPNYSRTPLISLDEVAKKLKVKSVFVKDESSRLGLPAFKILGASWGSCRAIIAKTGIPTDSPLEKIAQAAQKESIVLFTASAGNHGRALAAMARILGIQARIYVPRTVNDEAIRLISSEGAKVTVSKKDYDGAMGEAWDEASTTQGGLFVQDTAFEGYEDIPKWIVEGYSTLLSEIEEQLEEEGLKADLVVTPVGVGSLAHAVVRHCKSKDRNCAVMSVEPDTAACLYKSLAAGKSTPVLTTKTTMEGMNCGTLSSTVFEDLQQGIDASATVSDFESHQAIQYLAERTVNSGPCGGASLAALWRLADTPSRPVWLAEDAVVVIFSTEGLRDYEKPLDVSSDDPVQLTQILTTINSSNPDLSEAAGAGETAIANYVNAWLQHRGMEAHWVEAQSGRPSVVGVLRGTGGGKNLMINGHIDTVSLSTYTSGDPLSGELRDDRIYGRGCLDMKAGVAAGMAAMVRIANSGTRPSGNVILAAVADEENLSKGTEAVLEAGWKADAALVTEPTLQDIVTSHKGFVWFEIDVLGVAAHGSLPEEGVDAILLAGYLQTALLDYAKKMPSDPRLGQASLHGGRIVGGEEPSSYPAMCTLTVEFRTVPSQSPESIMADLEDLLSKLANKIPNFKYSSPRITFSRPPSGLADDNSFVQSFIASAAKTLGNAPSPTGRAFWCDAGLLNQAGIPSIVYGPKGEGLHAKEEWVSASSIREVTNVLETTIRDFCA
ncbi:diaminopropionate ammonia-lyase [Macroventuria anomochaeta]|uniref:Diaminopropionate ammonia-lyase n=1 Tax=Macroventuria anomochaeta TaxID=301207 RepID=A0ACB6S4U2_9PLEO|nr:diaminopropionate ammonia-lyase [Macroventuria anomochaeta]KAF2629265.1 diaminopropionate ammonia-lyase [Macroventuria anomochaeta]